MKTQKPKFKVDDIIKIKTLSPLEVGIAGSGVIIGIKANGYYCVKFSCRATSQLIHEKHMRLSKRSFFSLKRLFS